MLCKNFGFLSISRDILDSLCVPYLDTFPDVLIELDLKYKLSFFGFSQDSETRSRLLPSQCRPETTNNNTVTTTIFAM